VALTECPDCGREVSSKAESCPKCGCPLDRLDDQVELHTCPYCRKKRVEFAGRSPRRPNEYAGYVFYSVLFCGFLAGGLAGRNVWMLVTGGVFIVLMIVRAMTISPWYCEKCSRRIRASLIKD